MFPKLEVCLAIFRLLIQNRDFAAWGYIKLLGAAWAIIGLTKCPKKLHFAWQRRISDFCIHNAGVTF